MANFMLKFIFTSAIALLLILPGTIRAQLKQPNQLNVGTKAVTVAKSKVSIVPPEHFELSDQFEGFIHARSASTIQITKIDTIPYFYLSKGFTEEELMQQGATLISREEGKTNNGDVYTMILFGFTVNENEFERIMMITGDYEQSVIVNANYPKMGREVLYEALKESLLTVEF